MQIAEAKISIITINYNNGSGLETTVQSILNQSYNHIEYLVIDGGSTDTSFSVIERYKSRLSYWISEPDAGIYNAMNKGIRQAKGEYILFINSGDCLTDEKVIENAVNLDLNRDLVYGNLWYVNNGVKRPWVPSDELSFQDFYSSTIPHPCTFIKRSMFDIIGYYNEQLSIVSDWEFFLLSVCKFNCSYKHIDLFITAFAEDGISSSALNFEKIANERNSVLSRHFPRFVKDYKSHALLVQDVKNVKYYLKMKKFINRIFTSK